MAWNFGITEELRDDDDDDDDDDALRHRNMWEFLRTIQY
jgi:hypothetical protein